MTNNANQNLEPSNNNDQLEEDAWICTGGKNGKPEHEPLENYGETCLYPNCGLSRPIVQKEEKSLISFLTSPKGIMGVIIGLLALTGSGYFLFRSQLSSSTACTSPPCKDLSQENLVIGIITDPSEYKSLETYLENQLKDEIINVEVEAIQGEESYSQAKNKIANKEWDIVFAYSPMNSMAAHDNGYVWLARMFPTEEAYYQSVLYVRADSPINSIDDINSSHTIALGDIGSASRFYMPVYQLYGKTLNISLNNRGDYVEKLVKEGKVDIGSGVYSLLENKSDYKILQLSPDIPGSGVYISPRLTTGIQEKIKDTMLNASPDIRDKEQANYGEGVEPSWDAFRTVALRAEDIIQCRDLNSNPVALYGCDDKNSNTSQIASKCNLAESPNAIKGIIKGFSKASNNSVVLKLDDQTGNIYNLTVGLNTLNGVAEGNSPLLINKKKVAIVNVAPEKIDKQNSKVEITNSDQLIVIENCNI